MNMLMTGAGSSAGTPVEMYLVIFALLLGAVVVLAVAYVLFKKKYYHLHEEYLKSL